VSETRKRRETRRQLGSFYTPELLALKIVANLNLRDGMRVLEPSCGDGSFVRALRTRAKDLSVSIDIDAVEVDTSAVAMCRAKNPGVRVHENDFFRWSSSGVIRPVSMAKYFSLVHPEFDLVIGNPPFGGTIADDLHDPLDQICGMRLGEKIKKESYSFFIVKSIDHLKLGGQLVFICSDSFLTINTMRGLRNLLQSTGDVTVERLSFFSEETTQPMVILKYTKTEQRASVVRIDGESIAISDVERTKNLSWSISDETKKYFSGKVIGDVLVASSGMTIGNNGLFLREIVNGRISEPYRFEFFDDPITLSRELERARNGILSPSKISEIQEQERRGVSRRNVRAVPLPHAIAVDLPHPDYRPYNRASAEIVYSTPTHAVFWKDEGDAVCTFKKNGNWYLHGVGGKPYFGREGVTWALVASRLKLRYLPSGYILDSGAPCAFLRDGVSRDELFFLMAWGLTDQANAILKTVINHTRNIQGKDFERLPYPAWISPERKRHIVNAMQALIDSARSGVRYTNKSPEIRAFDDLFRWCDNHESESRHRTLVPRQLSLL
jgi:hypothetical protein